MSRALEDVLVEGLKGDVDDEFGDKKGRIIFYLATGWQNLLMKCSSLAKNTLYSKPNSFFWGGGRGVHRPVTPLFMSHDKTKRYTQDSVSHNHTHNHADTVIIYSTKLRITNAERPLLEKKL